MVHVPRDFDRWVQLRLSAVRGTLEVSYLDETGLSVPPHYEYFSEPPAITNGYFGLGFARQLAWLFAGLVRVPHDLGTLLTSAFAEFQSSRYHLLPNHTSQEVPWLLPVFIVPPEGLEALPWEQWVQAQLLDKLGVGDRCVAVRLRQSGGAATAFALPLRVHDSRSDADSMRALQSRAWYANEEAVRAHGVELTDITSNSPERRRRFEPHVLVNRGEARRPSISRRRLGLTVEVFDDALDLRPFSGSGPVLRISGGDGNASKELDPIVNLVYGLVHDYSLHELVWILRKTQPRHVFDLCCDPRTNRGLRLSAAMSDMRTEYLSELGYGGRLFRRGLDSAVVAEVANLTFDFTQERRGLTAMARAMAAIRHLEASPQSAAARSDPGAREDGRRVEMLLDRYDEFGVVTPLQKSQLREPFRSGWRYRLGVQIGLPSPQFGILDESPPDIDTAIDWENVAGDALGLEVCVFAKSFSLLSGTTKTLVLTRGGGPTRLVHFEFKAPDAEGTHDMRVAIYARNNLVQSFQLTALVVGPESGSRQLHARLGERAAVSVRLTSSAVRDLASAQELPSRALSVALNDDARPGDHTLMIKGVLGGVSVRTDESKVSRINARYRDVLNAAHRKESSWERTVRDMAKLGEGLWNWFAGAVGSETSLNALRNEGATLQFVRHSSVLSMPWHLVYDFKLPSGDAYKKPTICRADSSVVADWPKADELGCRHHPGKPVICVEGFWAFRHRLELLSEEMADGAVTRTRASTVRVAAPHPLLTFGASLGMALEQTAETEWSATYKGRFHRITPADAPVHTGLWNATLLPAVLLLLSHLHEADEDANLEKRVYACTPTGLQPHEISVPRLLAAKVNLSPWEGTRPIVLLMACESARQDTHELVTLTDAFLQSGAAAVIGTEWTVRAGEAMTFGKRATELLLSGGSKLGDVMQEYYRRGLIEGNSVPMLFTAYGNADLQVVQ